MPSLDPLHDNLRASLKATLLDVARRSKDPIGYLQAARTELTTALLKLELPDGIPGEDATREQITQALEEVWPEVIAQLAS